MVQETESHPRNSQRAFVVFNPLALIAEVTHRCPLHCVYCSNPMQLAGTASELSTAEWTSVFDQAGQLGMLHAHFTGGEPLARTDLVDLVAAARKAGLYTNLITSGLGLAEQRLQALVEAGLDHIQISFQDSREEAANWIAGAKAHAHKIELSRTIKKHKIAFCVNLVVHRRNLDHLEEMIAFIEQLKPERIEIAHTQYYGWALANRAALMPTRAVDKAVAIIAAAEERLAGRIRLDSVVPDYYAKFPKACMGGWGRRLMLINPSGKVLPCHAAEVLPGFSFRKTSAENPGMDLAGIVILPEISRRKTGCPNHAAVAIAARKISAAAAVRPSCSPATTLLPTPPARSLPRIISSKPRCARQIMKDAFVSSAPTASSFVQLQKLTADLWSYRTNPE